MEPKGPEHVFSPADRIQQLNEIDQDVAKLLHAAGLAVQALTNTPHQTDSTSKDNVSEKSALEAHQQAFKAASSQYFSLLSSIDVRLRRQVYALEEASIIRSESAAKSSEAGTGVTPIAPGAFNPLETSWLNTRKDTVGKDKEAELWADARDYVVKLGSVSAESSGRAQDGKNMDVD